MPVGPKKIAWCEWLVFFVDGFCFRLETTILLLSLSQICNLGRKFLKISLLHCGNYSDWEVDFLFFFWLKGDREGGMKKNSSTLGFLGPWIMGWDISK
jgi:hypothetical protein